MKHEAEGRLLWMDVVKGYAIILVVVGHYFHPKAVSYLIWSFHMPLFAFISGFFYKDVPLIQMIKKVAKRYLLPYVVCVGTISCIHGLINLARFSLGKIEDLDFALFMKIELHDFIWARYAWYFISLAVSLLLYRVLRQFQSKKISIALIVCIYFGGLMLEKIFGTSRYLPFGIGPGTSLLLWILLGNICKEYSCLNRRNRVVASVLLIIWIVVYYIELITNTPYNIDKLSLYGIDILGAIAGVLFNLYFIKFFAEHGWNRIIQLLALIGGSSAWIYGFHVIDADGLNFIWTRLQNSMSEISAVIIILKIIFDITAGLCLKRIYSYGVKKEKYKVSDENIPKKDTSIIR